MFECHFFFLDSQLVLPGCTASVEESRMTAKSIKTFTEPNFGIVRTCDPHHYILLKPISPSLIKRNAGRCTSVVQSIFGD